MTVNARALLLLVSVLVLLRTEFDRVQQRHRSIGNDRGAHTVEYVLIGSLIGLALIAAVGLITGRIQTAASAIANL